MSIDIDHVLRHFRVGHKLVFANHPIAEIVSLNHPIIEIMDIHHKKWFLNQDHLANVDYSDFLSDLASVIAQHCPNSAIIGSARQALLIMQPGDTFQNGGEYLATLIDVKSDGEKGPVLTFRDVNEKRRQVYPWLLPDDFTYEGFVEQIRKEIKNFQSTSDEPALTRYFKNEFIPKMLSQMDYDNLRWGDTWLMQPTKAQEEEIQEHINHYFEYYQQFGKKVPWLKVAGYAIIAQAREDHPEWLL